MKEKKSLKLTIKKKKENNMNIYGWIFMIVSWGLIIVFTVYSFVKVLQSSNKNSKNGNDNNLMNNSPKNS